MSRHFFLRIIILAAALLSPVSADYDSGAPTLRLAQAMAQGAGAAGAPAEKQAFEAAKELGTLEAWEAFLNNYPTGFHADLARAYVKKLAAPAAAPATAPAQPASRVPPPVTASPEELPCRLAEGMKSDNSETAAKIAFVNATNAMRKILWLDFDGKPVELASLEPGQGASFDTFLGHPWIAANASGDCSQFFKPVPGTSVARLEVDDPAYQAKPRSSPPPQVTARPQVKRDKPAAAKPKFGSAAANCRELGLVLKGGKCVAKAAKDIARHKKQKKIGCPAGTYLNPLGVCQPNETGS